MIPYLGDFNPGDTVRHMWNSNDDAGAAITRATNGTISVYQNLNTTQSTTGVTDTEDFDALTGVHAVAIDTSADGTFYAAGRDFHVVLSGATIDGQTVNAALFSFSLQNRTAADDATLAAIAALNNLSAAQVNAEVDTAIADAFNFTNGSVDANITHVIADPVQEAGATDTNWGGAP